MVYRIFPGKHSFGICPMTSGRALHKCGMIPPVNLSSTSETATQVSAESKASADF